ncbi:MAG: hypothetical protein J7L89_00080, partial [Bacteroidales bacterium]|nr:hypothetical protein [Bacteroidales bacterium]
MKKGSVIFFLICCIIIPGVRAQLFEQSIGAAGNEKNLVIGGYLRSTWFGNWSNDHTLQHTSFYGQPALTLQSRAGQWGKAYGE